MSLCRADQSSRGVLPSVVYLNEYDPKASKKSSLCPLGAFVLMKGGGWNRQYRRLSNRRTGNISFKWIPLRPFHIKTSTIFTGLSLVDFAVDRLSTLYSCACCAYRVALVTEIIHSFRVSATLITMCHRYCYHVRVSTPIMLSLSILTWPTTVHYVTNIIILLDLLRVLLFVFCRYERLWMHLYVPDVILLL